MPSSLLRIPLPYWLALALAFSTGSAAAAVYKWVDENGVTQYSEKPPPGKKPAEVPIRSQPTPATPQGPQSGSKTWQQQEAEFQQRRVEQEERRIKNQATDQADAEHRRRACLDARRDLEVLARQRPVYTVNAKGERVFIEDDKRDQVRERLRQVVEQTCDK